MATQTEWEGAVAGKAVLITGASKGIGAAAARLFADKGAKLGLAGRPSRELEAVAEETGAELLVCDVSEAGAVDAAVKAMVARHGGLDVLINNAGTIDPIVRIEEADPAAWARQIDVNLNGVFYGMRAALPVMRAAGGGTILTVGSGAAYNPLEGWSGYCASKAGAMMLTRAAHLEAGDVVRVLSLSPGTVATGMQAAIRASGVNPVSQLDWSMHVPPEWPARALLWMCSADADDWRGAEVSLREASIRQRLGLPG
ncbi:SDR family oxidoreductase [Pararhodobacter sp. SW119]|uniref:SDR family oxidoreductase n=1 Tax=Pararhodobacter sp. SW119 TaxID=2780075 RepID=UPI001ADFB192|nr:SDR family oxidoreductase [Pararhodobacter sp. SW119]